MRVAVGLVAASAALALILPWAWSTASGPLESAPAHDPERMSPGTAAAAHLGPIDRAAWSLARELQGDEWMRVWTRSGGGELSLRVEGRVVGTSAEIIGALREFDLLPTWNQYCDVAELQRMISPTEIWAAAGVRLPWPLPAQSLLVHAQVAADVHGARGLTALARSPSASSQVPQGAGLPPKLLQRVPLRVERAVGRLRPDARHQGVRPTRQALRPHPRAIDSREHTILVPPATPAPLACA
jgi:hypothetical protein